MDIEEIKFMLYYQVDSNRVMILNDQQKKDLADEQQLMPLDLKVSSASERLRNSVIRKASVEYGTLDPEGIVSAIISTDIPHVHPGLYALMAEVVVEGYLIQYILGIEKEYLEYLSVPDIKRTRHNIEFIADWLGGYRHYRFLIPVFRELELGIAYAQGQLTLIKDSSDLSTSLDDLSNAQ